MDKLAILKYNYDYRNTIFVIFHANERGSLLITHYPVFKERSSGNGERRIGSGFA